MDQSGIPWEREVRLREHMVRVERLRRRRRRRLLILERLLEEEANDDPASTGDPSPPSDPRDK